MANEYQVRVTNIVEVKIRATNEEEAKERALQLTRLDNNKELGITQVLTVEVLPASELTIYNPPLGEEELVIPSSVIEIEVEEIETKLVELLPPALDQVDFEKLKDLTAFIIPEGLTTSQEEAYTKMVAFLNTKEERFFRLSGYAGTGKSYLVAKVLDWVATNKKDWLVCLASPTNKAARNLQQICEEQGITVKAKTVASILGLQPEINDIGEQEFKSKLGSSIRNYELVFIDEYSMLDKKSVEEIFTQVRGSEVKIIFIGDQAQLPPINEEVSLVATHPEITQWSVLTEVVRYNGELARVAEAIRSNSAWNIKNYPFKTSEDKTIQKLSADLWVDTLVNYLKQDILSAKLIAWRNKMVDEYNKAIRVCLYGEEVEDHIVGDILIVKTPVFRKLESGGEKLKVIIFNTSEELRVEEEKILKKRELFGEDWEYWEVEVGGKFPLRILTPEFEEKRSKMLEKIKARALALEGKARKRIWTTQYYPLIEEFDCISYAYALTCHKAQGSSIPYVFLDVLDMRGCSDRQKILYTGLTRAIHCVYVY